MIIAISGKAGSGKSTIARLLAKKLNLKHYSVGDAMRALAKEKNISLLQLSRLAEKDRSIDRELDKKQIELAQKEDNFVIDGRLAAFFIPKADIKVFLECEDRVRAERILRDKREAEKSKNINEVVKKIKKREDSERKRYKSYYKVDYHAKNLYDCVIDTTNLSIEEVTDKIIELVKNKKLYK
jgi:cytidylate kinase